MITKFFLKRMKIISFFHSTLLCASLLTANMVFDADAATGEDALILIEAELMKTSDGNPFGIKAEIINPDETEYLVLFAPWGAVELFHVVLFDERGYAVSPLPVFKLKLEEMKKGTEKHLAVAPASRRFVRLPIPGEVRADPTGLTNGQLITLRKGKYRVLVTARGVCFKHFNAAMSPGTKPDYRNFRVTKDLGWVNIAPEYAEIVH